MTKERKRGPDDFEKTVRKIRSAKTSPAERGVLALSLGDSGDPRAIPVLRELIAEERSTVLAAHLAISAFGRDAEVESVLLERFEAVLQRWAVGQPGAYFPVVRALGHCGGAASATVLVDALPMVFASSDATFALLGALEEIGPATRPALEALRDRKPNGYFVKWAEELLERLGEST
jgi:hypothetical protein